LRSFWRRNRAQGGEPAEAMADDSAILEAIAGLKKFVDVIGTQTGQTELDIGEMKSDIRELKATVDRIETKVDRHEARIEALEARP